MRQGRPLVKVMMMMLMVVAAVVAAKRSLSSIHVRTAMRLSIIQCVRLIPSE